MNQKLDVILSKLEQHRDEEDPDIEPFDTFDDTAALLAYDRELSFKVERKKLVRLYQVFFVKLTSFQKYIYLAA